MSKWTQVAVTVALSLAGAFAQAQTSTAPTTSAPVLSAMQVDHVMVGVDDFQGMIAWYRDKLGFRLEKRWTIEGLPGIDLSYLVGPGGFRIEFIGGGKGPRTPVPETFDRHFRMRGFSTSVSGSRMWTPPLRS